MLAIELKRRAPNAHTFLEVVLARYGKGAHCVYLFFATVANIVMSFLFYFLKKNRCTCILKHFFYLACYIHVASWW